MQTFFPLSPLGLVTGAGLLLSACSFMDEKRTVPSMDLPEESPQAVQSIALSDDGDVVSDDLTLESAYPAEDAALTVFDAPLDQGTVVYFEYDSAVVSTRYMDVIQQTVSLLRTSPSARLRLEGHTDERGTRAYNLALGERRAQSVRDIVLERGGLSEQVDLISYGEELPATIGQGESAWAQNRRVELIIEE